MADEQGVHGRQTQVSSPFWGALVDLAREIFPPDLPPEFWDHLSRGLEELSRAAALYAACTRASAQEDALTRVYEDIMDGGSPRVGRPSDR